MTFFTKANAALYVLTANTGVVVTASGASIVIWADEHYRALGLAVGAFGILVQITFGIIKFIETKRHNKAMEPK